ncbi:FecR family protein [Carboxylicivirga sp. RSCT41]|uniref:FecR family protein n=1 Tax=Carboxylicivirga agarovorans TaxID=3417570 RepID=UPI003D34C9CE
MKEINDIIDKLKRHQPLLDKDYHILLHYLEEEGNDREFKEVLSKHWDEVCDNSDLELQAPDDLYYKIYHSALESEKQIPAKRIDLTGWIQRIAAVLFLPLLLLTAWNYFAPNDSQLVDDEGVFVHSPEDEKTRFFLPDGTKGWLQANSSIQYSLVKGGERTVELDGEAFFDVTRIEEQPFIVCTNDFKVKVLGTRFNVLADKSLPVSKVYLEEGSVEMLGVDDTHHTLLVPGEEYMYNRENDRFNVSKGVEEEALAWTHGILLLKNKSLKESEIALERFYNIDIEIADKELEEMLVYAKIQHEQLDEVLEMARLILPISYTIEKPKKLTDGTFTKRKVVIRKTK